MTHFFESVEYLRMHGSLLFFQFGLLYQWEETFISCCVSEIHIMGHRTLSQQQILDIMICYQLTGRQLKDLLLKSVEDYFCS